MPYKNVQEAESRNPGIRGLPSHAKSVWTAAFNSAKKQGRDDAGAAKIAWSAVSRAGFKKKGERWVKMTNEIQKAVVTVDGDTLAFGIPFTKINVKERTVEGFATLDNIDKADEIVDAKASEEAFSVWIGNIREMHQPKAVGKAIEITKKQYTDPETNKTYDGVWVKSKVSKGAPDTWEKILDGTLAGYSVGGKVLERVPEIVKSDDDKTYSRRHITRITKYHLGELSYVDNPMNALAVFSDIAKNTYLIKMDDSENLVAGEVIVEPKALFYCEQCDVAKTDDYEAVTIECISCDGMMKKIGEVEETPGITDLKKMVDDYKDSLNKSSGSEMYIDPDAHATPEDERINGTQATETGDYNPETNTFEKEPVFPAPTIEDANPELVKEVSLPEGAPQQGAMKAEGSEEDFVIPTSLAKKLLEVLKGRTESDSEKTVYREEELQFFEALSDEEMYKAVTNAHKTPPKGKPSDKGQYADPANFKYPIDSPARIRAAMVYFNHPGQRAAGGYSMSQWATIGRKIASAANRVFGSGHKFANGRVMGPNMSSDAKKADLVLNLQKNNTNVNNIAEVLKSLFSFTHNDSSDNTGGENPTLDLNEALEKVLDIFDTAKKEAEEVLKGFTVQNLNSEDASGVSAGGTDPGDAGVGTSDANDGGSAMSGAEVTVAEATTMAAPDAGPEKVVPDAIATDGTGVDPGTNDYSSTNVLPHAELAAKADEPEDLKKTITDFLDKKFEDVMGRVEALENSGGTKKSSEITTDDNELKKAETSLWGGAFYSGEWDK